MHEHAPYVIAKPLHKSQKVLNQDKQGTIFSIDVVCNFELEKELLGFGEQLEVLLPRQLRTSIERRLRKTVQLFGGKKKTLTFKPIDGITNTWE